MKGKVLIGDYSDSKCDDLLDIEEIEEEIAHMQRQNLATKIFYLSHDTYWYVLNLLKEKPDARSWSQEEVRAWYVASPINILRYKFVEGVLFYSGVRIECLE